MRKGLTMEKLKLCPCCGAAAEFMEVRAYLASGWRVVCPECHMQTASILVDTPRYIGGGPAEIYDDEQAQKIVADVWNRRPV